MPRWSMVILAAIVSVLLGSIACCVGTWSEPSRFIFLPGGDVGLGFRSHAGWLQWIEYAPWDAVNMDYPRWSVPWTVVILGEVLGLVGFVWSARPQFTVRSMLGFTLLVAILFSAWKLLVSLK